VVKCKDKAGFIALMQDYNNKERVIIMKMNKSMLVNIAFFLAIVAVFASQVGTQTTNSWEYKTVVGDLKPTAGCKDKDKAEKSASTGYRFEKYTDILCEEEGYGWGLSKVIDRGQLVCDLCGGDYEDLEKYRCAMEQVKVECKKIE